MDPTSRHAELPPDAPAEYAPGFEPSPEDKLALVSRVLDLLPDFFYVHDYQMRFRYANQHAARYFGRASRDELIGRSLEEIDPDPAQARFFSDICRRIMDEGVPRLTENLPYRRSDGTPGLLRQHDIPFINPRTGEKMLIGLARDVTAERDALTQRIRAAELEKELQIARQIQRSLQPPVSCGVDQPVELAGLSEPAVYAGGDFYDWGPMPDGGFVLGVGDVTGHGIGPALLAAACRAYARVLLSHMPLAPAMDALDLHMSEDLRDGRFVTLALAQIDPRTDAVQIASAGHGPIFILPGGPAEPLREVMPTRAPLGVHVDAEPTTAIQARLAPGEALVIASDGIIDALDRGQQRFGLPRLREALRTARGRPAAGILDAVMAPLRAHADGRPWSDDVTLVVARRPR